MAQGTPAKAATEIFNAILRSELDELEKLGSLVWRARQLCNTQPADFSVRVALASALLQTGMREEALQQLDTAFGLRQISEPGIVGTLAHLYVCVANYDRSKALFRMLTADPAHLKLDVVTENAARFAVSAGDVEYLREIVELTIDTPQNIFPNVALQIIEASGLADHLPTHQKIITEIVGEHQAWIGAAPVDETGGPAMLAVWRYLMVDAAECRALARRVTEALCAYYVEKGLPPGMYRGRLDTILSTMPAMDRAATAA